ncbi:DEAD/DEAH box helicase [Paenibacillus larvae]
MQAFAALGIDPPLTETLQKNGIITPTPIQKQAIPRILKGTDVIGKAQTGTGKTLAFILPLLQKIRADAPHIQGLIITPTRELALQITAELKKLTAAMEQVRVLAVYGGQDVEGQMNKLRRNVQIVVGTPGRLLDHIRRETIDLSRATALVLDEADQMLHIGFLGEVEEILAELSANRQTLLFSATMPKQVRSLAKRFMHQPETVEIQARQITVKEIRQLVVETTDRAKQRVLCTLLDEYRPFLAMVFCRTKRRAGTLNQALQAKGYISDELHGDLSQAKREQVMKKFREARLHILVATDVAARGLDVEGVTHVFNYDIPHDAESYIHRIGRTGRAGGTGLAVTLAAPKDRKYLEQIEKGIHLTLERKIMPGPAFTQDKIPVKREEGLHRTRSGKVGSRSAKNRSNHAGQGRSRSKAPNGRTENRKRFAGKPSAKRGKR